MAMSSKSAGFTLVEILIGLALVTILTMMMFQAVSPWMNLRQKIETERRLEDVKDAIEMAYRVNAMDIESRSTADLRITTGGIPATVAPSTETNVAGERRCDAHLTAPSALAPYLKDDANRSLTDGSRQPLCLFITPRLSQTREGVTIYYHVAAVVSPGNDGVISPTTNLNATTGVLTIGAGSDDIGVVINGFGIQYELFKDTQRRIERVADVYGAYFTARYLGNPSRDYSTDYFVAAAAPFDSNPGAAALPTGATWMTVNSRLLNLGLGPNEQVTPYESSNDIEIANQKLDDAQVIFGVQVQEPATKSGLALPPYTALLRARLPGPDGTYLLRVVPGNY